MSINTPLPTPLSPPSFPSITDVVADGPPGVRKTNSTARGCRLIAIVLPPAGDLIGGNPAAFVVVATCALMPQAWHESVYSVRILSLLMLSAIPGMLGRNAVASIDLNSWKEGLFERINFLLGMLETTLCLIGLILL
jgi:hypothetical protein